MERKIKDFSSLTTRELYEILRVRAEVFVVEQNCVYQDLDEIDFNSLHIYLEENGRIIAYLRLFYKDKSAGIVQIGRVLTTQRGCGFGLDVLLNGIDAAVSMLGAKQIYLEAQCYAINFYKKAGFHVISDEFLEDGIPHVQMLCCIS